jgi:zinc protease
LHQALIAPRFDTDAVERVKGQIIAGLTAEEKDPQSIAGLRFNALAFGKHPYATSGEGTAESVAKLTRDDVVDAHRAALARDRMFISVVGDVTPAELGPMLDRLFDGLPDIGRQMPGRAPWDLTGGVTVVDFPSPQSVILFGQQGIARDDPDFFAAFMLNEVLGGSGFSARLMDEIREKRGLTYGVSTYLAPMNFSELMLGQMSTANATVAQSIDLIREAWVKLAADGITEEELTKTKTYLTGAYPLRFDGNGQIADILVGMQMEGLPIDYAATRNAKIEAVTLADVKRVAQRLLQPDALHFVVVGQPDGVVSGE